jgi:hypothetical protein
MKDGERDVDHIVQEFEHRNPANDSVRWFRRQYLRHTHFERLWWVYLLLLAGWWLLMEYKSDWQKEAREHYRQELAAKFCANPSEPSPAFCEAVDPKPKK